MSTDSEILKTALSNDVHVLDSARGYVAVPSYNIRMNPLLLQIAARMIREHFAGSEISVIHGIPNSGHFLATAVALEMGESVRLHNSRKDNQLPTSWKETLRTQVRTFTGASQGFDVLSDLTFSSVRKGDSVLIVDDVCGHGNTGVAVCQSMLARGITVVGFAVMLDKLEQGGLTRIESLKIPVFSCVRIKSFLGKDGIQL